MFLKISGLTAAALGLAILATGPSYAQSFSDTCDDIRSDRETMGAVLGGIAGGLIGNQSAAHGVRSEGTALGLVVGALAGSQLAKGDLDCSPSRYGLSQPRVNDRYSGRYPVSEYDFDRYDQPQYPVPYPNTFGYSDPDKEYDYRSENRNLRSRKNLRLRENTDVAGSRERDYNANYSFAGRECAEAKQITRLPDGTEIHRPIEACREAHYGEWSVIE